MKIYVTYECESQQDMHYVWVIGREQKLYSIAQKRTMFLNCIVSH